MKAGEFIGKEVSPREDDRRRFHHTYGNRPPLLRQAGDWVAPFSPACPSTNQGRQQP